MNLQDFAALKTGDKIENPMNGSKGTIAGVSASGVHLTWDGSQQPFFYSVQTTAWMHWRKAE